MFVPVKPIQANLMFAGKAGASLSVVSAFQVLYYRVGSMPYSQLLDGARKAIPAYGENS
jgi:hypothetical protein